MTVISVKAFGGLRPISQPRLLDSSEAQVAQNVKLVSGALVPMKGTNVLKATTSANPQTIFRYGTSATETNYWLEFAGDVDVVKSPIAGDQYDRLYWTDGVLPRYAPNSLIVSGASYPGASYQLGVPAPSTAPTISSYTAPATFTIVSRDYVIFSYNPITNTEVTATRTASAQAVDGQPVVLSDMPVSTTSGFTKLRIYRKVSGTFRRIAEIDQTQTSYSDSATDASLASAPTAPAITSVTTSFTLEGKIPAQVVPEARTYVYTYVTAYGEEGPPSAASTVVNLDPAQSVTVTVPSGSPTGAYNITLKRIYRSSTVGSAAQFQFVAEIPLATGSYVDSVTQSNLGEILPSEDWVPPPAGLKGLKLMANGVGVGFVGRTLYLSEPFLLHAWPHQYSVDNDIVGLGVFGQSVVVLTKGNPYVYNGIDPAAMSETRLAAPQSCASKPSIVDMGDGVLYSSPDGLVMISPSGVSLVTEKIYSREQWQALNPSSIRGSVYNGRYVMSHDASGTRGVVMFDFTGQGAVLTTSNINTATAITASFYDPTTDTLYFAQGGNIVRFDRGSNLTTTWKSKVFRLPFEDNFAIAQVQAESYPVTFKIYGDGVLRHTETVASSKEFRLPSGFRCRDWEFQIEGSATVTEVAIANSVAELRGV